MSGTTWTKERMARLTAEEIERLSREEYMDLVVAYLGTLTDRQRTSWLCAALLTQGQRNQWDEDRWDAELTRLVGRTEAEETGQ